MQKTRKKAIEEKGYSLFSSVDCCFLMLHDRRLLIATDLGRSIDDGKY